MASLRIPRQWAQASDSGTWSAGMEMLVFAAAAVFEATILLHSRSSDTARTNFPSSVIKTDPLPAAAAASSVVGFKKLFGIPVDFFTFGRSNELSEFVGQ